MLSTPFVEPYLRRPSVFPSADDRSLFTIFLSPLQLILSSLHELSVPFRHGSLLTVIPAHRCLVFYEWIDQGSPIAAAAQVVQHQWIDRSRPSVPQVGFHAWLPGSPCPPDKDLSSHPRRESACRPIRVLTLRDYGDPRKKLYPENILPSPFRPTPLAMITNVETCRRRRRTTTKAWNCRKMQMAKLGNW